MGWAWLDLGQQRGALWSLLPCLDQQLRLLQEALAPGMFLAISLTLTQPTSSWSQSCEVHVLGMTCGFYRQGLALLSPLPCP